MSFQTLQLFWTIYLSLGLVVGFWDRFFSVPREHNYHAHRGWRLFMVMSHWPSLAAVYGYMLHRGVRRPMRVDATDAALMLWSSLTALITVAVPAFFVVLTVEYDYLVSEECVMLIFMLCVPSVMGLMWVSNYMAAQAQRLWYRCTSYR